MKTYPFVPLSLFSVFFFFPSLCAQTQLGSDLLGLTDADRFGIYISFSNDGSRIAVAANQAPGSGFTRGQIHIFEYDGAEWQLLDEPIEGEADGDRTRSASLSADGSRVAVGAPFNSEGGPESGNARVFEYQDGSWVQLGSNLVGEAAGDAFGRSISLSADGQRVAVGAYFNDAEGPGLSYGHTRVFEYDGVDWIQLGADIDGEKSGDYAGWSVSLSADGGRVAVGARLHDGIGDDAGQVRVYEFDNGAWVQLGEGIDAEAPGDNMGFAVSLSAAGDRVATGAPGNSGGGSARGQVRVYEYQGSDWVQLGADIDGVADQEQFGFSVSLSADGTRLIAGAPFSNNFDALAGQARMYAYTNGAWTMVGLPIDGTAENVQAGFECAISGDGQRIAVGAPIHNNGTGQVRVYGDLPVSTSSLPEKIYRLQLFPNPSNGLVNLYGLQPEAQPVVVSDALGRTVARFP
ncbi:MAG: PD40 domain-containing protein, partial [Saprospiraceae bacterium]|nr:PD40 domain-containing protein [Saprospiraceae bacterium]